MKKDIGILLMIGAFFLLSCQAGQKPTPLDDPMVETPAEPYAIDKLSQGQLPISNEDFASYELSLLMHQYGLVDSFIVIYKDQLCCEKYFNGYTRHIRHKTCSVAKSIVSAIVGILLERGIIESLDEKLLDIYTEDYPRKEMQNRNILKESITLRSLLNMSAGFQWEEISVPYYKINGQPNPKNSLVSLLLSDDKIKHMLDLPLDSIPGLQFNYCSGEAFLMESILEKKTGLDLESLAGEYLFSPLGIGSFAWQPDNGANATSQQGGLDMHPVDMAQFGLLFLKNGYLNGQQIIGSQWVEESTAQKIAVSLPIVNEAIDGYGYYWWHLNDAEVEKYINVNDIRLAWGFGGQLVVVCPHLGTVIVSTGRNYEGFQKTVQLFQEVIMPLLQAIEKNQK